MNNFGEEFQIEACCSKPCDSRDLDKVGACEDSVDSKD